MNSGRTIDCFHRGYKNNQDLFMANLVLKYKQKFSVLGRVSMVKVYL